MKALLTTEEVAELLRVKPRTVRSWVHLERIPVVRIGRTVRFKVDEIELWLKGQSFNERARYK
jgi:excisionase family DNA binding protein